MENRLTVSVSNMTKLPSNFELDHYGLHCRLVTEDDAEFITALRADARLGRYIHTGDGDVEAQKAWTRKYKEREAAGEDYYFIFSKNGENIGLCRIYNIDWTHLSYTSGSWVMKPGLSIDVAMIPSVIMGEIAHQILGLLVDIYDVRKGNKQVLSFHRNVLGAIEYGETEMDILFMSTPESRKKSKLRKLLGLPVCEEEKK